MKRFNTTAVCFPYKHYMVNLESRLKQIKKMVDDGDYFIINRARQYGKTTTLRALREYLKEEYIVISLDFQSFGTDVFNSENTFVRAFLDWMLQSSKSEKLSALLQEYIEKGKCENLSALTKCIVDLCSNVDKPIVLMIDEMDKVANVSVFLGFLAQLRYLYINREEISTFQSVILAGIQDIRLLKSEIREENDHMQNSPWNIAIDFEVDMSFSSQDINGMLIDYAQEHFLAIETEKLSDIIFDYTSGYPFLVSRICQIIDEKLPKALWTEEGIIEAVKLLLRENNTLFKDMVKKLGDYPQLKKMLQNILLEGKTYTYNLGVYEIDLAAMYGFIKNDGGKIAVANRIFETYLYNLFIDEERVYSTLFDIGAEEKNQFIKDGYLNMELVLEKFVYHYNDVYGDDDIEFLESNARKLFLLYIRPIINGVGNYYIEAQTREATRTDIIIDYKGRQYIIEMKIWHGNSYNKRGEEQLREYLELYHIDKGYMLSFNFNKNKEIGMKEIKLGNKILIEAIA